jgi:DNA-binding transcriptional regulator YdaS (Cro superfamily)
VLACGQVKVTAMSDPTLEEATMGGCVPCLRHNARALEKGRDGRATVPGRASAVESAIAGE